MERMPHLTGIRREVLAELEYAESQLLALAEVVPAEDYGWTPAEDARTFAAVLVHVAVGNFGLLDHAGAHAPEAVKLYAEIEGDPMTRVAGIVRMNISMENMVTEKTAVVDLLARSFAAVKASWTGASEEELWGTVHVFGELETVRRLYLRMLAHSHEHMGQAIAYTRAMGYRVPWPDPVKMIEQMAASPAAL
jgi:hypothetical protein